jgi:transposase
LVATAWRAPGGGDLSDDVAGAKAMRRAAKAEELRKRERIAWLVRLIASCKQAVFGWRSEKVGPDRFERSLKDRETPVAALTAEDGAAALTRLRQLRAANRGALPTHLQRIEEPVEADGLSGVCGGGLRMWPRRIGTDVAERLDIYRGTFPPKAQWILLAPARFRVTVTGRPKYGCRACADEIRQAAVPARPIAGGLPTEPFVANVLIGDCADPLPSYRRARIYDRQGVGLIAARRPIVLRPSGEAIEPSGGPPRRRSAPPGL